MSVQSDAYDAILALLDEFNDDKRKDYEGYVFKIGLLRDIGYAIQHAYDNGGGGGGASDLEDLTDVVSAGVTSGYVLVANGVGYVGRPLVEADISDLGSYLTAETNDLTAAVTWANIPDAYVPASAVTQHQAALTITESQISDLGAYITDGIQTGTADQYSGVALKGTPVAADRLLIEDSAAALAKKYILLSGIPITTGAGTGTAAAHNHIASEITSGTFANARISASSVTQHQASLSINPSQLSTTVNVAQGGTNATTPASARANLGLQIGSDVQAYSGILDGIALQTATVNYFLVGDSADFVATSPADARTALGLGSLATLSNIDNSLWSGTDLAITNGGTGASTAADARVNLGLEIGVDIPALSHTHTGDEVSRRAFRDVTTSTYTLTEADAGAICDAATAGSAITINLPAASSSADFTFTVIKKDVGGNPINVTPNGTDNINGANLAKAIATPYEMMMLVCDGTEWFASSLPVAP